MKGKVSESKALPCGWERCTLPDFTRIVLGQSPDSKTYNHSGEGLPFFQGKAEFGDLYPTIKLYCSTPKKIAEQGATLLSVRAPVGPTNLAQSECCIGRGLVALHPCGGIEPKFVLYLFRSIEPILSKQGTGSTFKAVTKRFIENLEFNLPPLAEQNRIVSKIEELFSELDKGVEILEKAREQLKVYRQAVLKHAFEGKLTAQWREKNKDNLETPELLLARIKHEREVQYEQGLNDWKVAVKEWETQGKQGKKPPRPQKLNETKILTSDTLPTLPEKWAWFQYEGLCSLIRNGVSKKPEGNSGKKIFRISAVRPMEFDLNDVRFISDDTSGLVDYYLKRGDLIFTRYNGSRAYVGVCAEYKSDGTHLYPDKLIRTQLGTSQAISGYLEKAVNSGESRRFIESRIRTTAGQSGISGSDIKAMPVPLCSPMEQSIIQDLIEQVFTKLSKLLSDIESTLNHMEALRQSILKKAFSGQLVAQDPNDEPASKLLARIHIAKSAEKLREQA